MKPITYYVETPSIRTLCLNYGDYLEHLSVADRLALAAGLVYCSYTLLGRGEEADLLGACDDHEFGNGSAQQQIFLYGLLESIDEELTDEQAAQLASAILQTVYPIEAMSAIERERRAS